MGLVRDSRIWGCGGNHKLFLRGWGINENAFDGVLGEVVYLRAPFGVNIIR